MNDQNLECCPRFEPAPWDAQEFSWKNKTFVKDRVCTFMFMPLNFGKVIRRLFGLMEQAGASTPDNVCLSDHTSPWNMDIYVGTDREVPGAQNTSLTGRYFSKVYEGNFKESGKWCKDFNALAASRGYELRKMYMWYTTCPKCARKYGKNYVVVVGQIG